MLNLNQKEGAARSALWVPAVVIAFAALVAVGYVSQETPTWYWDFANYHEKLRYYVNEFQMGRGASALQSIARGIRASDYNATPILPLLPVSLFFTAERSVYILSLVLLYLLPASALTYILCKDCSRKPSQPFQDALLWFMIVCFPGFWGPTLRGFPDVLGLIPLGAAGHIILRSEYLTAASRKNLVLAGVLLWVSFLIRRWYAYGVVSIVATTAAFAIGRRWSQGMPMRRVLRETLAKFLMLAAPAVILLLLIQPDLTQRILSSSYEHLYEAYQTGWREKWRDIAIGLGPANLLLLALGIYMTVRQRNYKVGYCLLVALLYFLVFGRTQALGMQHRMFVYLWLFPAVALPLLQVPVLCKGRGSGWLHSGILAAYAPIWLALTLLPTARITLLPSKVSSQLSATMFPPLQNKHYQMLQMLVKSLEKNPRYANKRIAVLPSSTIINEAIIAEMSKDIASRMVWTSQVDQRDGFWLSLLDADVIVATSQDSIHLPAEHQRVITLPSKELFDPSSPLAAVYVMEAQPVYELNAGNQLRIFLRRDHAKLDTSQLAGWLLEQFRSYYPQAKIHDSRIILK